MPGRTILVAGATGHVGSAIVHRLKAQGERVRALTRKPEQITRLPADETVVGDIRNPEALIAACRGVDAVISASGASLQLKLRPGAPTYTMVDEHGNGNLLAEAQRAGVQKFVYVSVYHTPAYADTVYVQAHTRFADRLQASGMPYAVLEPTGLFYAFRVFLQFARLGIAPLIGGGTVRTNPMHEDDLAALCVAALDGDNAVIPTGGPEVFTRRAIAEMAFEAVGKRPRFLPAPSAMIALNRFLVRPIDPRLSQLLHFFQRVNTADVVAPKLGTQRLADYFRTETTPTS